MSDSRDHVSYTDYMNNDMIREMYHTGLMTLDDEIKPIYENADKSDWRHIQRATGHALFLATDYAGMEEKNNEEIGYGMNIDEIDMSAIAIASRMHDIAVGWVDPNEPNWKEEHQKVGSEITRILLQQYKIYSDKLIDEVCYIVSIHDNREAVKASGNINALAVFEGDKLGHRYGIETLDGYNSKVRGNIPLGENIANMRDRIETTFITPIARARAYSLLYDSIENLMHVPFRGEEDARSHVEIGIAFLTINFNEENEELRKKDPITYRKNLDEYISRKLMEWA